MDATPPDNSGHFHTPSADFNWQFEGRITVLDNGARLPQQKAFKELMGMNALAVVAFDPASRLHEQDDLDDIDEFQVIPHALLGDGEPTTLYACQDPAMTATLEPLAPEQLPERMRSGAQVLTQLPIATVAMDSITGLDSVDWLLLDERYDSIAALEHGQQYLKDTLLIHARMPFMPTHQSQPNLGTIYQWMMQHGFQCYQFVSRETHSHLPQDVDLLREQGTHMTLGEAIFIPDEQRLAVMPKSRIIKLAFLLDAIHKIHDFTYSLLARVDTDMATAYLAERGYVSQFDSEADTFVLTADYAPAPWPMPEPVLPSTAGAQA